MAVTTIPTDRDDYGDHHHRGDSVELDALVSEPADDDYDRDDGPLLPNGADGGIDEDDGATAAAGQGKRKPAVIWLVVFFLINSLAFGIAVVPRINLVVSLICRQTLAPAELARAPVVPGADNPQCAVDAVSARTAVVQGGGNVLSGLLSAVVSTGLSMLSDRVGRVRVIAYSATVLMGAEVVLIVLANTSAAVSFRWLYAAYALDGLSGSFATIMVMASAYISDCESEERRNVQVGRIHGSMFIGIAVGPAISSAIIAGSGKHSPLLVFYVCQVMRALSIFYLLKFVPESLSQPRNAIGGLTGLFASAPRWEQISKPARGIDALVAYVDKLNPSKWLDRLVPPGRPASTRVRRNVILLLLINIVCYAGAMSTSDVLILYPQLVFKWGNVENNMFMSVINGFRAAVSTLGIPVLIFLFRKPSARRLHHHHHHHHQQQHLDMQEQNLPADRPLQQYAPASPLSVSSTTARMTDPSAFPDLESLASPATPSAPTPTNNNSNNSSSNNNNAATAAATAYSPGLTGADPLDRTLILTALVFDILGYAGYAAAPNGVLFTLCGAFAAFGAVGLSTSEAALTKHVQPATLAAEVLEGGGGGVRRTRTKGAEPASRVGELMAGLGLLQALVRIVAPALVNLVYGGTVAVGHPAVAFLGVAGTLVLGAVLTVGVAVDR